MAVTRRLDEDLMGRAGSFAQRPSHVGQLLLQTATLFDPEFLDVRLNAGGFEADAEGGQDEESNEKDFARVPLDESAQVEEMPLKFRP